MKKIITVALLLLSLSGFAQKAVAKKVQDLLVQNVTFKKYNVLTENDGIQNSDTQKAVTKATYGKINLPSITNLISNQDAYIEVEIPYLGNTITTQLYKVNLLAEGFHIDTDKARSIAYAQGSYYRGIVKGDSNSIVSFNFFKDEFNAVISSASYNNLVVAKLDKANNNSDYVVYSDNDLRSSNNFLCNTKSAPETATENLRNTAAPSSTKCVTMYFEIDFDLYEANNSNTTTTTNWMTSVFNNVQTLYNNDGITISLKSLYIWTTEDPYSIAFGNDASSADYLYKFNELRPVFDGDLGQLLGIDQGGLGGVAVGINGICSQDNFSYSDVNFSYSTVPTYSWTIMVITHELGHLLGSPHTHACRWNGDNTAIDGCGQSAGYSEGNCDEGPIPDAGTIMSYCHLVGGVGINLANGFGPQPAARILSKVEAGTCLSTDCINTCINTVANITVTATTNTTADITWTDLGGATNWQVSVTPFPGTNPTWATALTNSYTATLLSADTYYIVRVRPICTSGLLAPNEQTILVTSTSYCNGVEITDTGGTSDDYTDSETYVRTIIPNLPNKKIALTFTAFDLELDYDYLYVYDGNSTSAPDLSNGGFTGDSIPGPFVSSAADGSLTVKFYSDGGVVAPGYVANVVCESTLGNSVFEPNIDFTYAPNPTNGNVTISSKTILSEVFVYNVEGRLLYQKKPNAFDTKVDMGAFANGTYFFKLKFNDKEANFKILKMN